MHFVALGPCMLGTFWEHFRLKWASDGVLMGPWTHMDTKMKAHVDKITNLMAIWSPPWSIVGPTWPSGKTLEARRLTLGGLVWLLGPSCPPRPILEPNMALQDRFLRPTWLQDPLQEGLWKPILDNFSLIWGTILVDFWLLCWSAGFLGCYFVGCLWSDPRGGGP